MQCNWACCHLLDVQPIVKLCRPFYFVHFHIWCIVHTTPQSTAGYCPPMADVGSDKAMQCNATEPVVMLRAAFQLWGYNATQYIMDVWKCQYTTKPVYDFGNVEKARLASRAIFLQQPKPGSRHNFFIQLAVDRKFPFQGKCSYTWLSG